MGRNQGGADMVERPYPEGSERQNDLLRKYCTEAERLLSEAADFATAIQLKDSLCEQFQRECESSLVIAATREYLEGVIRKRWRGFDVARNG
jgi:hypothetical protein